MGRTRRDLFNYEDELRQGKIKYLRIKDGAMYFSLGVNTFRQIAAEAQAVRRLKGVTLYNIERIENYIELVGRGDD